MDGKPKSADTNWAAQPEAMLGVVAKEVLVDFVTRRSDGGREWVDLKRLTDGRVMCCLCFTYTAPAGLNRLPDGDLEDACRGCARKEANERLARENPGQVAPEEIARLRAEEIRGELDG